MPLIDQMLIERQRGLERVKDLFGVEMTVSLNSSWETNSKEEDAELEQIENAADASEDTGETTEGGESDNELPEKEAE